MPSDVTVVAASVRPVGHCILNRYTASTTLTPGTPVYLSANNTVTPTNAGALATAKCIGLVLSNSNGAVSFSTGEEVDVLEFGMCGGTWTNLTAGLAVFCKNSAGVLQDAVGTKICRVGIGISTTKLLVNPMLLSSS